MSDIKVNVDASQGRAELASLSAAAKDTAASLSNIGKVSGGGFAALSNQIKSLSSGFDQLKRVSGLDQVGRQLAALSAGINSLRAPSSASINGLNNLAKALRGLQGVSISSSMGANLRALGAGLSSIRPPNMQALNQLPQVMRILGQFGNLRINTQGLAGVAQIGAAFTNFKTPTAAAATRLTLFMNALRTAQVNPQVATGIAAVGAAFNGFRAPSQAAARNIQALMLALGNTRVNVGQLNQVAAALQRLNGVSVNVGRSMRAASSGASGGGYGQHVSGANALTGALRGLENQFSLTYHASSMLRQALGALTLGEATSSILETGNGFLSMELALNRVATSAGEVQNHMAFLPKLASETGGNLQNMIGGYTKLAVAMEGAGHTSDEVQKTFAGFSKAFSVQHVSNADQQTALRDLSEVFSMGKGHAQQISRGLASHIPGVMSDLAKANDTNVEDIEKKFKGGGLDPSYLVKLGEYYNKTFNVQLPEALKHSQASINGFLNQFTMLREAIFKGGFDTGLATMMQQLTQAFNGAGIESMGQKIGKAFQESFQWVGIIGTVLIQNIDKVAMFGAALVGLGAAATGVKIIQAIVSPLLMAGSVMLTVGKAAGVASLAIARIGIGFAGAAGAGLVSALGIAGEAVVGLATAFGIAGTAAEVFGVVAQAALIAGLAFAAYEAGKAIGDFVNNVFPNAAKKIGDWKASLFGSDPANPAAAKAGEESGDSLISGMMGRFKGLDFKTIFDTSKLGSALAGLGGAAASQLGQISGLKEVMDELNKAKTDSDALNNKLAASTKNEADTEQNATDALKQRLEAMFKMSDAQQKLVESTDKVGEALRKQAQAHENFQSLLGKRDEDGHFFDQNRIDQLQKTYDLQHKKETNPFAQMLQDNQDQIDEMGGGKTKANNGEYQIKKALQADINKLAEDNVHLTAEQTAQLEQQLRTIQQLKKGGADGFQQWANGIKSMKDSMDDFEKNGLDQLSDKLADFASTGKADFVSLGQSLLKSFDKMLIDQLMKNMIQGFSQGGKEGGQNFLSGILGVFGGNKAAAPGGAGAGGAAGTLGAGLASQTAATMNVTASVVNVSGGLGGAGLPGTGTAGVPGTTGTASPMAPLDIVPAGAASSPYGALNPNAFGSGAGSLSAAGLAPLGIGGAAAFGLAGAKTGNSPADQLITQVGNGTALKVATQPDPDVIGTAPVAPVERSPLGSASPYGTLDRAAFAQPANPYGSLDRTAFGEHPANPYGSLDRSAFGEQQPSLAGKMPGVDAFKSTGFGAKPALASDGLPIPRPPMDIPGGKTLALSDQEIHDIAKVSYTETANNLSKTNPQQFDLQRQGVVDTIMNRKAVNYAGAKNVEDVVNQKNQFSKINGPSSVHPYGSVEKTPDAPKWYEDKVRADIESRASGSRQDVTGGGLDYLNPSFSSAKNMKSWGNAVVSQGRGYGAGNQTQYYGLAPGHNPVAPYNIRTPQQGGLASAGDTQAMFQANKQVASNFQGTMASANQNVAATFKGDLSQSTQQIGSGLQSVTSGSSGAFNSLSQGVSQAGSAANGATSMFGNLGSQLSQMLSGGMGGGGGGMGGLFSGLGGMMGGGMFAEGGFSDSPVSMGSLSASAWSSAPAYAEGTANTSGGMPAILHDNEAVIPLSRGRSVPVELNGAGEGGGDTHNHFNVHLHGVEDFDSFRRSEGQVKASVAAAGMRAMQQRG